MDTTQLLIELKNELHDMNNNITRLIERDKVQNKRIDDMEYNIKEIKKEQQQHSINIYKIVGFFSCAGFLIPLFLRLFGMFNEQ